MPVQPNVRLSLANTAENVAMVRAVLAGVADAAGIHADDLGDIRTAVSEACNNVVQHAYEGERGPLDLTIALGEEAIEVTVRDHGIGIGRHAEDDPSLQQGMGIGLHVIRTLAREARFDEPPGGGTRVVLLLRARGLDAAGEGVAGGPELDLMEMPSYAAAVSIAPVALAKAVVPRLVVALAARAHFSTDRLSDVQLLSDAVADHAVKAVRDRHVSVGVLAQPRDLELRIAPLAVGQAEGLVRASDLDGLGRVIEKLADRHHILAAEAHETLALSVLDPRLS